MIPSVLLRKELRQLLPWALMILSAELAFTGFAVLTSSLDQTLWAQQLPIVSDQAAFGHGTMLMLWAFTLAYAGFPREFDDGTLPFLFSLPVRRRQLFAAKFGAALLILIASIVLDEIVRWLLQLPSSTFYGSRSFRLDWAVLSVCLSMAFAVIALGYGFFASVFRRFGVLLVLVAAWTLEALEQYRADLAVLNPLRVLAVDFHGGEARVPWKALGGHLLASLSAAAVAAFVWVGPMQAVSGLIARWMNMTRFAWLFVIGVIGTLVALAVLYAPDDADGEVVSTDFGNVAELSAPAAELATERYNFHFPEPLRERVERLARRADHLHGQVVEHLGGGAGARVEVDLTQASAAHAGSATWDTMRLDLVHASSDEELERTFVHETAHVVALRASDRRMADRQDSTRFFEEGLAEHVAARLSGGPSFAEAQWLQAALARQRHRLRAEDLVDGQSFRARFGDASLYPVGFTWVEALVAACGDGAPRQLLRAIARKDAPRHLRGTALWQDTLQAAGCELGRVNLEWQQKLDAAEQRLGTSLAAIPRVACGVNRRELGATVVRCEVEGKAPDGAYFQLLTRADVDAAQGDYCAYSSFRENELAPLEFFVADSDVADRSLRHQLVMSWIHEGQRVALAERWQEARVVD